MKRSKESASIIESASLDEKAVVMNGIEPGSPDLQNSSLAHGAPTEFFAVFLFIITVAVGIGYRLGLDSKVGR